MLGCLDDDEAHRGTRVDKKDFQHEAHWIPYHTSELFLCPDINWFTIPGNLVCGGKILTVPFRAERASCLLKRLSARRLGCGVFSRVMTLIWNSSQKS